MSDHRKSLEHIVDRIEERTVAHPSIRILRRSLDNKTSDPGRDALDLIVEAGITEAHMQNYTGEGPYKLRRLEDSNIFIVGKDEIDPQFIELLKNSLKNSRTILSEKAQPLLDKAKMIYNLWSQKIYGVSTIDEISDVVFDPPSAIIRWDHKDPEREIFGNIWGIPKDSMTKLFSYWKMAEFPPTYFESDELANSSLIYVTKRAKELGVTPQEVLDLAVAHEYAHRVITNPIGDLFLEDATSNWWVEAVAIMYTDYKNYQRLPDNFYNEAKYFDTSKTISSEKIDCYQANLATWLAICSLSAKSSDPKEIYSASNKLIEHVVDQIKNPYWAKIPSSQIPAFFGQFIGDLDNEILTARRNEMLDMLKAGQF